MDWYTWNGLNHGSFREMMSATVIRILPIPFPPLVTMTTAHLHVSDLLVRIRLGIRINCDGCNILFLNSYSDPNDPAICSKISYIFYYLY